MTRSGATSQTYPTPGHKANPQFSLRTTHPGTSPTQNQHTTKANHFQAVQQGVWPQSFRISGGDSENNTRPQHPPQIHAAGRQIRGNTRQNGQEGTRAHVRRRNYLLWAAAQPEPPRLTGCATPPFRDAPERNRPCCPGSPGLPGSC